MGESYRINKLVKEETPDIIQPLEQWFARKLPDAGAVEIDELRPPSKAAGMSGDTFIASVSWTSAGSGQKQQDKFVVRAELAKANCPESNFERMVKLQHFLGENTDLSIPKVLGYDLTSTLLGGPFYVMEYIEGVVAADSPPHTTAGWFYDATPDQRQRMYHSGVRFLVDLHRVDWQSNNLDFLSQPGKADSEHERRLNFLTGIYDEAMGGERSELMDASIKWLQVNLPKREQLVISWGDCRAANMLWRDFKMVGALDWEMCGLGSPCLDLALWYLSELAITHGIGVAPLEGMFSRQEFIDTYEAISGKALDDYDYYEMFSAFRMNVIISTMVKQWEMKGQSLFGPGVTVDNTPHALAFKEVALQKL